MHVPIHTGREKKDKDINQDINSGSALIGFLFLLHTLFSTLIHYSQSGKGGRDKQEVQCTYLI